MKELKIQQAIKLHFMLLGFCYTYHAIWISGQEDLDGQDTFLRIVDLENSHTEFCIFFTILEKHTALLLKMTSIPNSQTVKNKALLMLSEIPSYHIHYQSSTWPQCMAALPYIVGMLGLVQERTRICLVHKNRGSQWSNCPSSAYYMWKTYTPLEIKLAACS